MCKFIQSAYKYVSIVPEVEGSESVVRPLPNPEIDSACACVCVVCVSACEAAGAGVAGWCLQPAEQV